MSTSTPAAMAWRSAQFEASAVAAAPFLAAASEKVGTRILRAVEAVDRCSWLQYQPRHPVAVRPARRGGRSAWRWRSARAAARRCSTISTMRMPPQSSRRFAWPTPAASARSPSRMSRVAPTVGLLEAMAPCCRPRPHRRGISDGLRRDLRVRAAGAGNARRQTDDPSLAVITLHMAYLAYFPDSHIARKHGVPSPRRSANRRKPWRLWQPVAQRDTLAELLDFDAELKRHNVNPGTTADLVVATLFAASLCDALGRQRALSPLSR